jgi:membrane-associated protease RseP (regulator of RpoE activity)
VARRVGIRCPEFAIGFGKALFSRRHKGTLWALRMVPVGGYVQMIGEDPAAETGDSWHEVFTGVVGELEYPVTPEQALQKVPDRPPEGRQVEWETVREHLQNQPQRLYKSQEELEGNFNAMTIPQRVAVVLGGVIMNFMAAILLMWFLGFVVGIGDFVRFRTNRLSDVMKGSVAEQAKLEPHDAIVKISGHPISSGSELMAVLGQYPGQKVDVEVQRGQQILKLAVTPDVSVEGLLFRAKGNQTVLSLTSSSKQTQELKTHGIGVESVVTEVDGKSVTSVETFVQTLRDVLANNKGKEVDLRLNFGKNEYTLKDDPADLLPQGKVGVGLESLNQLIFTTKGSGLVRTVTPGSLAAQIGLEPEDRVVQINNVDITGYETFARVLQELSTSDFGNARVVSIHVLRKDDTRALELKQPPPADPAAFGLTFYPITAADRLKHPFLYIEGFITMPYQLPGRLLSGATSAHDLKKETQGPLGMMQMIYEIAQEGWPAILFFLAILNAAVGGFNLIPFPALDGMRCLLLIVSSVRKREFNPEKEAVFHFVGLAVLLVFVLLVTYQDIMRLWAGTPIMK